MNARLRSSTGHKTLQMIKRYTLLRAEDLALPFTRNEPLVPQGIISCATPQGTLSAASGIHLGAIHLISRP